MREKNSYSLTKDESILIGFDACHTIAKLFLGTFVVSFLMHNSINEIVSVSIYKLFYYIAITLTYILCANWCKNGNKNVLFGFNIVTRFVLMALIAILGVKAIDYVVILGILYGIFGGFYFLPINSMIIEKISGERMQYFISIKSAISNTFKIVFPVILGILITIQSLQNVAWVIMGISVAEFIMLLLLSPNMHRKKQPVDLIGFWNHALQHIILRKLFLAEILRGLATVLETVVTMYIVYVFHTDMNLGIWTTIFAICTIVASWAFGRFCSKRDYKWVIGLCSLMLLFAAVLLFTNVTQFSTLVYAFASTICIEIMAQICNTNVFNIAHKRYINCGYSTEYLVIREILLFVGRWTAFISLAYLGVSNMNNLLGYYIIVAVIAQIIGSVLISSLTKKI